MIEGRLVGKGKGGGNRRDGMDRTKMEWKGRDYGMEQMERGKMMKKEKGWKEKKVEDGKWKGESCNEKLERGTFKGVI